jgi:aspartyl-tRNA(Asn)/glutamyl-tRNA(Gln) amidotransferase subunit C
MVKIDSATIKRLATLCRIACTEKQEESLLKDMQKILAYMEQLNEIPTDDVEPCNYVIETVTKTPQRPDIAEQTHMQKMFLKNAPQHIGTMIRVPPVLKQE